MALEAAVGFVLWSIAMFAELFLSACAVAAVFAVLGSRTAVLFALPLLVWAAYRLGRICSSIAAERTQKARNPPPHGLR